MAVEDQLQEELTFMDVELGRHAIPEPSDGEVLFVRTCETAEGSFRNFRCTYSRSRGFLVSTLTPSGLKPSSLP